MPWQLCSASVKPAGTIQVFLENSKKTPEDSIKFKTEVIFIKICCKAYIYSEVQHCGEAQCDAQYLYPLACQVDERYHRTLALICSI